MICSVCAVDTEIRYKRKDIEKKGKVVGFKKPKFGWVTKYRVLTEEGKIEYVYDHEMLGFSY